MENNRQSPDQRDPKLWELAKRRASFKYNLASYIIINAFLWGVWYFSSSREQNTGWPWPIWPTLGWGVGLVFHYIGAYVYTGVDATEREYEKLKEKQQS